ncbi:kelch-like protein 28 [Frankliniella occidentalis]|uniref:Kelch-like protein 28 n=1 Tax=Frankliniella occidentalis TaxID=133901 RepID=A0A6J1TNQ5_FRAOC|nr:kelch-like protein 28 [Frankliniella occidentalis]XP_052128571.1 kelch-like protein 28 [Frankliniella occidentalis]
MAAERHASMPLLLLAEQTVDGASLKKSSETTRTHLAKLETKDKRVSFVPVMERKIEKDAGSACECLSLDLFCSHTDANSLMIQCKMTVEDYDLKSTKITNQTIKEESFVLKDSGHNAGVVSLKTNSLHNKKVTVLFMVYSISAPHPATGAGLHLNRARSEGTLCDVKLLVDGVELPAHRAVLAVRSAVLNRMLTGTGDFKEAREGRVELVDTSAAAVEKFLEFLYTDRIEVWHDSELDLLHLAEKYMVPELRTECCLRLWSCEPPRALSLLNATALATGTTISSALRQRLTTIVANNLQTLTSTKEWADFKAAYPVIVDTMLGASRAQTRTSTLSVWE